MSKFNDAFWKWFGGSKVVDSHGQPLVVYHGTNVKFSKFDLSKFGSQTDSGWYGKGFYFTVKPKWASNFAEDAQARSGGRAIVYPMFLSIQKPMKVQAYAERGGDLVSAAKKRGYDGLLVVFDADHEEAGQLAEIVAFYPEQIKAVDNDGTWDADDPDIRSNPFEKPEPPDSSYDSAALAAGIAVEFEHTSDPAIAKRIAKDHLDEDPDYYAKLKTLGLNPGDRSVHDREIAENPSWVDKIVKQHCAPLEAYAQAHGLPMPVLDNCKPSKEFGCGHYGCVMATSDPGVVFKITSDESEAHFIACYQKLRDKLPFDDLKYSGIVDYKAIVGLKESSRRARRVYAIWREEAQNVGKWENGWKAFLEHKTAEPNERNYFERQTATVNALMRTFQANAGHFRLKLKSVKDRADYFDKVREAIELSADIEVYGTRGELQFTPPSWIKGTRRLAFHLRTCRIAAELLESEYLGDLLGKTLGFFLEQGLLLADVHNGNLGTRDIDKEAIITDPGHLVILKPEWEQVNIEAI